MAEEVRFFDNRQRYLLFVTTTNEKAVIAEKLSHLINELNLSNRKKFCYIYFLEIEKIIFSFYKKTYDNISSFLFCG